MNSQLSDLSINERIYNQKDRVIAVLAVHLIVLTIAFTTLKVTFFGTPYILCSYLIFVNFGAPLHYLGL